MPLVARKIGQAGRWNAVKGRSEAIPAYAFDHPCDHAGCRRRGLLGFGVDLLRRKGGTWFCDEHKGDGEHA